VYSIVFIELVVCVLYCIYLISSVYIVLYLLHWQCVYRIVFLEELVCILYRIY
jgi:hypothetical protein